MKKMTDLFKTSNKIITLQRLFLFFLTRVLLIRLNTSALISTLRKLWPHLLNELITVFEKNNSYSDDKQLTVEAIKLVELLSSLNIEDFQMNQWIFLIDGYGMKEKETDFISELDLIPKKAMKSQTEGGSQYTREKDEDLEKFRTFIIGFIGTKQFSFYNVDKPQDGIDPPEYFFDEEKQNDGKA